MKGFLEQQQSDNVNIDEIVLEESKLMLQLDYNDEELLLFAKEQQKVVASKVKHMDISEEELRNMYYSMLPQEQSLVSDNNECIDSLNNNVGSINPSAISSSSKQAYTHLSSVGRVSDIRNVSCCRQVSNSREAPSVPSTSSNTSSTIPVYFGGKSTALPVRVEKKSSDNDKSHTRKFLEE